jgi:hypothetical protein
MDLIIKKPVATNSIVSFRLISGEEIVGKLISNSDTTFVISKPILIGLQSSPNGMAIAFMPYMATLDDSAHFTFKHAHVLNTLETTRKDVERSYISATTGIEPAAGFTV